MLNNKLQLWRVNISTNKTIIFNNMLNSLKLRKIKKLTTTEEARTLLKRRKDFWVLKLITLYPGGLNEELKNTD